MAKAIDTLSIKLDFKAGSGSQQIIDKIGSSIKKLQVVAGQTGPSIDKVRRSVNDFAKQGNRSISTIEGQVTALRALRREADINSKEFKELTADIGKYEKQLNKAQGRRGGGGARQATQVAGAVISGGIFGGPEGAVGGALGAFGGVQGAFAGAAIGAQVGGIRKAIGAAADYAAQIGKLKIALEGVTDTSDEYTSALAAAARVSAELNVPQEQAIRGITRLSAAVKGAGGPMADAETTFRNVTAAIKATGGSSDDVKGAITAMVQVFSKGKVSAEELSGQLGERLPGAVTMFAKANEMTLPQLQKNLKAGTVGLNELMNFIVELGVEFDGTAKKIASSNEEAGARLTLAFDDMKTRVGGALISTGAELQNTFAKFIKEITPVLVQILPVIAKAFAAVAKNIDKIVVAAAAALAIIAVGKIAAIVASIGSLSAVIFTLKLNAIVAAKALVGLNTAALLNPYTALAAGAAALAVNIYNAAEEQKRFNLLLREGSVAEVDKQISEKRSLVAAAETRTLKGGEGGVGSIGYEVKGSDTGMVGFSRKRDEEDISRLRGELKQLDEARRLAVENRDQGADLDPRLFKRFEYDLVTTDKDPKTGGGSGGGSKSTLENRTKQAQQLESSIRRRLNLAEAEKGLARFLAEQANKRGVLEDKITKIKEGGSTKEIERATAEARNLQTQEQAAKLKERVAELSEKALKPLQDAVQAVKEQAKVDERIEELIREGISPQRAEDIVNLEKIKKKTIERLNVEIDVLRTIVAQGGATQAQIDALDALMKKRKEAEDVDPKETTSDGNYDDAKSEFEQFQDAFTKGLEDMMNVGPKLAGVAVGAIGTMTDGLIELITTGKTDFKAMAASILQDIAKIMLQAAIAGAVKKMFGFADGGVIQGGRLKPYAKGGVVGGPTVFPMAGGDVGLMGEAGPEAIMPLKRGPGGRLGVEVANQNSPREAMSRYSRGSRGSGVIPSDGGSSASGDGGVAVAAPIDVRYTVERINSVDYVTADQFQNGMQSAAAQGAQRGEQNTLKRLQMSGSTRKRIGL